MATNYYTICGACVSFRSPQAYADLKLSGMLVLPTERLLRYYKNAVRQRPGINSDQLEWMESEAELANLTEYGRHGGLLLDEMTIQDDLQVRLNVHM